jgi:large subunit ribosomal protein L22
MVTIKQRFIHTSARKLRLIADTIRGKSLDQAQATLAVLPQKGAQTMAAIVKTSAAAAKDSKLSGDLFIHTIHVDEGPAMKRRVLAGRGRSTRFEHRMSHVTLSVDVKAPTTAKTTKVKTASKPSEVK